MGRGDVVIVGAGRAGQALARTLRRRDETATITLIAASDGAAYPKPPLACALSQGRDPASLVQASGDMVAARQDLHLLVDSPATGLDLADGSIEMCHGRIPCDRLVLALGEEIPVPHPLQGAPGVHAINRLHDYQAMYARLQAARRVLVIGASAAGCEFANDVAASGREAILLDTARHPLGERLPGLAGDRFRRELERAGVRARFGDRVMAVEAIASRRFRAHTAGSERLDVDLVVVLGEARPRTALAQRAGLRTSMLGIAVDTMLRCDREHVYALGACANLPEEIRHAGIEAQAVALAETLGGRPCAPESRATPLRLNTPACPLVWIDPPPIAGQWEERATADGVSAAFFDSHGRLRGFALVGATVDQRDAWTARVVG